MKSFIEWKKDQGVETSLYHCINVSMYKNSWTNGYKL